MNRHTYFIGLALCGILICSTSSCNSQQKKSVELKNANDTMSWIVGENFVYSVRESGVELNKEMVLKAVEAMWDGDTSPIDNKTFTEVMDQFRFMFYSNRRTRMEEAAKQQEAMMADLAKKDPSLKRDDVSGIYYKVVKEGHGRTAPDGYRLKFNYEGRLLDGKVFDNSFGTEGIITLPANVIKGLGRGLTLMNEGSRYIFYIPSHLAFGPDGQPEMDIPSNTMVVYEVELYKILED